MAETNTANTNGTEKKYDEKLIMANLAMLTKKVNMDLERGMDQEDFTAEEEKILALRENPEFLQDMLRCNDVASVQEAFKKQGLQITEEEAADFIENVQITSNKVVNANEELSDEELAEIAGGSWLKKAWKKAKKYVVAAAVSAVAGAVAAVAVGVITGGGIGVAAVAVAAAKGVGGGLFGAGLSDLWNAGLAGKIGVGAGAVATVIGAAAFVL